MTLGPKQHLQLTRVDSPTPSPIVISQHKNIIAGLLALAFFGTGKIASAIGQTRYSLQHGLICQSHIGMSNDGPHVAAMNRTIEWQNHYENREALNTFDSCLYFMVPAAGACR